MTFLKPILCCLDCKTLHTQGTGAESCQELISYLKPLFKLKFLRVSDCARRKAFLLQAHNPLVSEHAEKKSPYQTVKKTLTDYTAVQTRAYTLWEWSPDNAAYLSLICVFKTCVLCSSSKGNQKVIFVPE